MRIKEIGDIMKKRLFAFMLAFTCVAGAFSAVTAVEEPVTIEATTKKKAPSLNKVYNAVKKVYGENYAPSERLDKDAIKSRYGIASNWYSNAIAEVPMMSFSADECVIVKAKNADAKKKIKKALQKYQKTLKQDVHQYPMNLLKIQASKIYVKGDYVCFFILGSVPNEVEEQEDESKVIEAYKKQNNKAVNAIKKLYK